VTKCQWCGQEILFHQTREGKWVALNEEPDLQGTVILTGMTGTVAVLLARRDWASAKPPLYRLHRQTCSNWAGKKKGKAGP